METRRLSKTKHWRLVRVVTKAAQGAAPAAVPGPEGAGAAPAAPTPTV
jgi:hypothetical protein